MTTCVARTGRVMAGTLLAFLTSMTFLPSAASAQSAQHLSLYDRIKQSVEQSIDATGVEKTVAEFIASYFSKNVKDTMTADEVTAAIQGAEEYFCGGRQVTDPEKSQVGCRQTMLRVQRMAADETRVRRLGRDLQLAATSYELPISDLPGRSLKLSSDLRGIVNVWSTDNVSSSSSSSSTSSSSSSSSDSDPWPIRVKSVDPNMVRQFLTDIGNELGSLSAEERTAAVWRYQYGERFVKGERAPLFTPPVDDGVSGAGTERQFVFKRWTTLEEELDALWRKLAADTFTPPLRLNESALYLFPKDLVQKYLPDNVIIWARVDGDPKHPMGDVGLQWETPLEPVLPSLTTKDGPPILGGTYPPEPVITENRKKVPVDGVGLCTGPTALRGYLCRPFTQQTGQRCLVDPKKDPTTIALTTCIATSSGTTVAGSDVCRDLSYQLPAPFDPSTQCKLNVRCASSCGASGGESHDVSGLTSQKAANGTIDICVTNDPPDIPARYVLYHELHHAYQLCNQKPGFNPEKTGNPEKDAAACCRMEGEAYRAQADLMERDGVFKKIAPIDGIPMNAETYAEAWTDFSCGVRDGFRGCPVSRTYTPHFMAALATMNKDTIHGDVCPNILATINGQAKATDPYSNDLMTFLQHRKDVCVPGRTDLYKNRIGNNMCYIGQCVEQTLELHRVTAAQSPATVGDETAPWNDPQTGSPLGNLVVNPPLTPGFLPLYRPQFVVDRLESALCQLQGLPAKTPPVLCAIKNGRRLNLPLSEQINNMQSLLRERSEQETATADMLRLSLALGSRIGTTLYADMLRTSSRSFASVLSMAVTLFKEMTSVTFPTQMCPLDQSLAPPIAPSTL